LHPTPYCAPLEQFARDTLLGLDAAVTSVRNLLRGDAGRVCIGVTPGLAQSMVSNLLPVLRAALPELVPNLQVDGGAELVRALEAGALDFALLPQPPLLDRAPFSFLPLGSEELVTLVRPAHRFANALLVPTRELLDGDWVLPPRRDPVRECVGFALLAAGSDEPARLIEANSLALALDLARRFDVVTVAPASMAQDALTRRWLVSVNTPYRLPPLQIGVMRERRRELRAGSHRMLALLLRELRRERTPVPAATA
jgi:LysR family transcriptional regulator of abg operon